MPGQIIFEKFGSLIDLIHSNGRLASEALAHVRLIAVAAGEAVEMALTRLGLVSKEDLTSAFA